MSLLLSGICGRRSRRGRCAGLVVTAILFLLTNEAAITSISLSSPSQCWRDPIYYVVCKSKGTVVIDLSVFRNSPVFNYRTPSCCSHKSAYKPVVRKLTTEIFEVATTTQSFRSPISSAPGPPLVPVFCGLVFMPALSSVIPQLYFLSLSRQNSLNGSCSKRQPLLTNLRRVAVVMGDAILPMVGHLHRLFILVHIPGNKKTSTFLLELLL